ncbi:AraC family transcriptional regulator [Rhizocola hellebori]|uniref:AraC family transcriptional regulator n=1 Tax=Rhizocola hellebori TaxID=1392758 RepID=A0A8J3QEV2_9ACTN|nr:helix-turn-helix domain-containing protein [Rhizocola hellebori]GIH08333.1 AraC family transcriptional regulator [Rhizocola hellebori]
MLTRVAVLAFDQIAPFELGVLCEVFGTDRSVDGFPLYDFALCSVDGRPVQTRSGFMVTPHADLKPLRTADLVAVPAHPVTTDVPPEAIAALTEAAERGAWILSVCSGAFALGQAGLLDGRRCTTHWKYADQLAKAFPSAEVVPDALYVHDGRVITSAGTAAGIDACLHLVRQEHGATFANKLARRMVVPPHRAGGQAQFIEAPVAEMANCDTIQPLLEWLLTHLDEPLTVDDLAHRSHMAPRTFARRFRAETGASPHDWLTHQRVLFARRLLEETDLPIEQVAVRAGFGDGATLRHHFSKRAGTTPQNYRQTFRG